SPEPRRLQIGIAADLVETRPRFVKGAKYVRNVGVSPSGARAVVEFRGEIVTVPAEKGDPRYLTTTPGIYERDPAWPPAGKTLPASTSWSSPRKTARVSRGRSSSTATGSISTRSGHATQRRSFFVTTRTLSTTWTSRAGKSPASSSRSMGRSADQTAD